RRTNRAGSRRCRAGRAAQSQASRHRVKAVPAPLRRACTAIAWSRASGRRARLNGFLARDPSNKPGSDSSPRSILPHRHYRSARSARYVLVLGSGTGGKLVAWQMAKAGRRTAVVERKWIGGSCPNIACMPSKNEISSARVAHLVRHAAEYGWTLELGAIDMAVVRKRKRDMVAAQVAKHLENYKASGAELIMGSGRFVAPKTIEVLLND